jgi:hypothetical protein
MSRHQYRSTLNCSCQDKFSYEAFRDIKTVKSILKKEREQRENGLVRSLLRLSLEKDARKIAARLEKDNALMPEIADLLQNSSHVTCWKSQWTPFVPNLKKYGNELQKIRQDLEKWNQKYENIIAHIKLQQDRERLLREAERGLDSLREFLKNHPMLKVHLIMTWKPASPLSVKVDKDTSIRMIKHQIQEHEGVDASLLQIYAARVPGGNCKNFKPLRQPASSSLPSMATRSGCVTGARPRALRSVPFAARPSCKPPPPHEEEDASALRLPRAAADSSLLLHDDDTIGALDIG